MAVLDFEDLLIRNIWLSLSIYWIVAISDYYLTLYGAQLYKTTSVTKHIIFEGSYELNPSYQQEINSLQRWSPRFVGSLLRTSIAFILLRVLIVSSDGASYEIKRHLFVFLIGIVTLGKLAIDFRHIRNIVLFRATRIAGGITGRIEYPRWLLLNLSATESFSFAGLFILIGLIERRWLFLGGAVACLINGLRDLSLSRDRYRGPREGSQ